LVDPSSGRARGPLAAGRPHMLLKELTLHVDRLKENLERRRKGLSTEAVNPAAIRANLAEGIAHYRELAARLVEDQRSEFSARLEQLRADLDALLP
jgi:putative hemolysin